MSIRGAPIGDNGLALWHARTVHELADAVRVMYGQLAGAGEGAAGDIQALQVRVAALEAENEAQATAISALQTEVAAQGADLTDLEARVAALEAPAAP